MVTAFQRHMCQRVLSGASTTCAEATPKEKFPNAGYWCWYCKRHFEELGGKAVSR